jgi:hypothetical protein
MIRSRVAVRAAVVFRVADFDFGVSDTFRR